MAATGILVVAEVADGGLPPLAGELLGLARALAGADAPVALFIAAPDDAAAADAIAHGADCVYHCPLADPHYDPERWMPSLEALVREMRPRAVLTGHTPAGADLAPRLAARLDTAVVTGCTGIAEDGGTLIYTRACFGGNVREAVSLTTSPGVASVKAGVGTATRSSAREGRVVRLTPQPSRGRVRVVSRSRSEGGAGLENARTIVAGGRGLEGPEGFRVLETLAAALGGVVGSSRVPCDLGWCPHSWQIGLTGKTVAPELYFAVGISGAGHHMAGCGNSKAIVAINTDPDAAIFREARFGIVGDYRMVVPAIVEALKEQSS